MALVLLALEWLGADFDGLMAAALAGLALSLMTALLRGLNLPVQLLLFGVATASVLLLLQSLSRRRGRAIPSSGASERATVISGFESAAASGRVRWQGQSWAATNLEPDQSLMAGEAVLVMGRDGNRLQVLGESLKRSRRR
jgi:membrane protein implicated in regulation of membrane protease activity